MAGPIKLEEQIKTDKELLEKVKKTIKSSVEEYNNSISTKTIIYCPDGKTTISVDAVDPSTIKDIPPSTQSDTQDRANGNQTMITDSGRPANLPEKKPEEPSEVKVSAGGGASFEKTPVSAAGVSTKQVEKQTTKLNQEIKNERIRLYEQAILMLNYKTLMEQAQQEKKRHTNFAKLVSSGGMDSSENPAEILNNIFKKPIKFDLLLNASSAQMSYLLPSIRIYKQYTNKQKNRFLNLELPLQQQYELEDFETIFKNREGRGGGAGFKSIKMSNIGDSMAMVDNYNIDISFIFADLSELSKVRYIYHSTPEEKNEGFPESISVSFFDLLLPNTKNRNAQDAPDSAEIDDYQIKIIIGWHVNRMSKPSFITEDFIDEIESLKETFYLTKGSHSLDFGTDGSIDLKIKYLTYMDSSISNPREANLLFNPQIDKMQGEAEKDRVDFIEKRQEIQKELEQNPSAGRKKQLEIELKAIESKINNLSSLTLEQKYRRFINNIYEKGNIKFLPVSQTDFSNYETILNNISEKKEKIFDDLSQLERFIKYSENLKNKPFSLDSALTSNIKPIDKIPTDFNSNEDKLKTYQTKIKQSSDKLINILKEQKKLTSTGASGTIDKIKVIPFFYLGDLIDAILEDGVFGGTNFYTKNLKVLVGPMYFYDFGDLTYQKAIIVPSGIKDKKDSSRNLKWFPKAKVVNIADIPISLSLYQQWFIEEIINENVNLMTFDQFMNSIFTRLIVTALGNRVYPWSPQQNPRLIRRKIVLNKKESRWKKKDTKENIEQQDTNFTKEHFEDNNRLVIDYNFKQTEELERIYYITGLDNAHRFTSNYDDDIKIGVRHLYFNNENGFVKSIKFTRNDMPYLESSLLTNANASSTIKLLGGVYDANIDMIGNSFFRMGERIYINPTIGAMGLKQFEDQQLSIDDPKRKTLNTIQLAKSMGIGGYYIVTSINTTISSGDYTTQIKCRYESPGIDGSVDYRINIAPEIREMEKK